MEGCVCLKRVVMGTLFKRTEPYQEEKKMDGVGHVGYQQGRRKQQWRKKLNFRKKRKELCMHPHLSLLNALQLYENLMQGREHTDNLGWFGLVSLHLYLPFCYLWNSSFLYPS